MGRQYRSFLKDILQTKLHAWAKHRSWPWVLGVVAFFEALILPTPLEVWLVPTLMVAPQRWRHYLFSLLLGSFLGSTCMYFLLSSLLGYASSIVSERSTMQAFYTWVLSWGQAHGWYSYWLLGLTPIPQKILTLGACTLRLSWPVFIMGTLLARSIRLITVSYACLFYGHKALHISKR